MEQQNLKFDKYKFDATPYIIAANSFSKQFKEKENENSDFSKNAFDQLDLSISEKLSECSKINKNLKELQTENVNMQMELDALKREEEQLSRCSFNLKEALKCVCKATFVQDNEKCLAIARKIQERFGFKLKLIQCQDNPHLSIAKFSFDRSEIEVNCFVSISYDIEDESFALHDMKPKPKRFSDMKNLLAKTNDITGLLYFCWKSFKSVC